MCSRQASQRLGIERGWVVGERPDGCFLERHRVAAQLLDEALRQLRRLQRQAALPLALIFDEQRPVDDGLID